MRQKQAVTVDGVVLTRKQVEEAHRLINEPEPEFEKGKHYAWYGYSGNIWQCLGKRDDVLKKVTNLPRDYVVVTNLVTGDIGGTGVFKPSIHSVVTVKVSDAG